MSNKRAPKIEGVASLTVENIDRLPDNYSDHARKARLNTFIADLQAHKAAFEKDGRIVLDDLAQSSEQYTRKLPAAACMFGTPTLKARNFAKTPAIRARGDLPAEESNKPTTKRKSATLQVTTMNTSKKKKFLPSHDSAVSTRTRYNSDEEREARLTHRRERRRKKRAVVEIPKESISPGRGEDGTDDQATETTRAGRKAQKVKKQSAGYALMHGFAATNVGKGRLTMKPDPVVGVFNKGKASSGVKATKKGPGANSHAFSEEKFLNKLPARKTSHGTLPRRRRRLTAPSLSSHSSSSSSEVTAPVLQETSASSRKRKLPDTAESSDDSDISVQAEPSHKLSAKGGLPTSREIKASALVRSPSPDWDIEQEDVKLPSGTASLCTQSSQSSLKHGTVALKAENISWTANKTSNSRLEVDALTSYPASDSVVLQVPTKSPQQSSVGPSDSASQPPRPVVELFTASKYFDKDPSTHTTAQVPVNASPISPAAEPNALVTGRNLDTVKRNATIAPTDEQIVHRHETLGNHSDCYGRSMNTEDHHFTTVVDRDSRALDKERVVTDSELDEHTHSSSPIHDAYHVDDRYRHQPPQFYSKPSPSRGDTLLDFVMEARDAGIAFYRDEINITPAYEAAVVPCTEGLPPANTTNDAMLDDMYFHPVPYAGRDATFVQRFSDGLMAQADSYHDEDSQYPEDLYSMDFDASSWTDFIEELVDEGPTLMQTHFRESPPLDGLGGVELDGAQMMHDHPRLVNEEHNIYDSRRMDCHQSATLDGFEEGSASIDTEESHSSTFLECHEFGEGQALLLGMSLDGEAFSPRVQGRHTSVAEQEIVKGLRGHWLPQRL